jgi:hypothetical protein
MTAMFLATPHVDLAIAASTDTSVDSWRVSAKHGTQSGIGADVSGSGAWAKVSGHMNFQLYSLETSKTYQEMHASYKIASGISGFWGWLGFGTNAETHKDEIHKVFNEISKSQKVDGYADFDLDVSGQYPNVQVTASAYVMVLQITDAQGNTYNMVSKGDPKSDTGAQDQNGNSLPTKNNESTISI